MNENVWLALKLSVVCYSIMKNNNNYEQERETAMKIGKIKNRTIHSMKNSDGGNKSADRTYVRTIHDIHRHMQSFAIHRRYSIPFHARFNFIANAANNNTVNHSTSADMVEEAHKWFQVLKMVTISLQQFINGRKSTFDLFLLLVRALVLFDHHYLLYSNAFQSYLRQSAQKVELFINFMNII